MSAPVLHLNGEERPYVAGTTLADLVAELGLAGRRFAVERNGDIVPRSLLADTALQPGDRIEVVHAIGGG